MLPLSAYAEGIDLKSYAMGNLTEIMGYTSEEAAEFVFDEKEDGSIAFWHPDYPDWIYTVSVNRKTGQIVGSIRGHVKDGTLFFAKLVVHPDFRRQGIGRNGYLHSQPA